MKLYSVYDREFAEYGCVLKDWDCQEVLKVLGSRECPEGVVYVPSDEELEALPAIQKMQNTLCGKMPIQAGYTNGHCTKMNALEYHKSSEWNVSDEDIVLFLGRRQDLSETYTMDTAEVKAFLLPKGVLVEVYATTLHYAPCQANKNGYRCLVILPEGTNYPVTVTNKAGENILMTATNKWLVGHPQGRCEAGTYIGLTGENPDSLELKK